MCGGNASSSFNSLVGGAARELADVREEEYPAEDEEIIKKSASASVLNTTTTGTVGGSAIASAAPPPVLGLLAGDIFHHDLDVVEVGGRRTI